MPFCVECGVRLAEDEKSCPLCRTVVVRPGPGEPGEESPGSESPGLVKKPVPVKGLVLFASLIFFLPILITVTIDVSLNLGITWSFIVTISVLLVWSVVILPLLLVKLHPGFWLTIETIILSLYLILLNLYVGGALWSVCAAGGMVPLWAVAFCFLVLAKHRILASLIAGTASVSLYLFLMDRLFSRDTWFLTLALPVTALAFLFMLAVLGFVVYFKKRPEKRSRLMVPALLVLSGFLTLGIDLAVSSHLVKQAVLSGWSLYSLFYSLFVALCVYVVMRQKWVVAELKRRFHT